ncbi:hypothetical protein RM704_44245 [Streptomyces sp. DSM 3412]|uniref:Uncharacterized protein n=1 Tax=Streptomyces gottesmaniae TaxID=3075518 RepID=A0ABU2ZCR5_9ACTN|nr:hypothetical protein [Streptomyces sp. DSM 3412]MDT0574392.1 hypothetical protein [Streptomyces sp. DSM 3412]
MAGWSERLRQAFLRFDRRHGGAEPPPRVQVFVARHPVGAAVVFGVLLGGLLGWALSAFHDPARMLQAVAVGLCGGLFVWLFCRFERRRQAHYARNGGFRWDPPRPAVRDDALPVWFEGLLWLSHWTVLLVLFWLVGRLRTPPFTWVQSAIYAGFLVVGSWAVHLAKERRRRRQG